MEAPRAKTAWKVEIHIETKKDRKKIKKKKNPVDYGVKAQPHARCDEEVWVGSTYTQASPESQEKPLAVVIYHVNRS